MTRDTSRPIKQLYILHVTLTDHYNITIFALRDTNWSIKHIIYHRYRTVGWRFMCQNFSPCWVVNSIDISKLGNGVDLWFHRYMLDLLKPRLSFSLPKIKQNRQLQITALWYSTCWHILNQKNDSYYRKIIIAIIENLAEALSFEMNIIVIVSKY